MITRPGVRRSRIGVVHVLLLAALGLPASPRATVIATHYNPANGHYYHLLAAATWAASEAEAISLSGHLVTVNDAAENAWIEASFKSYGDAFWLGYTDAAVEGTWVWVSGETPGYSHWGGIEPNDACPGAEEDVAAMVTNGIGLSASNPIPDGHWIDIPGSVACFLPTGRPPMGVVEVNSPSGVRDIPSAAVVVLQNHPNPFSEVTEVEVRLAAPSSVAVDVFDASGALVASRLLPSLAAGSTVLSLDGRDAAGRPLPSGVYFYRVRAAGAEVVRKMVIAR